jgi:drug/metabolite transporter (DMT)-like permease
MPSDTPDATDRDLVTTAFWEPHASPRSVWPLVAAYPLLLFAIYRRNPRLLGGTLLGVVANLLVVSPPETDEAWATRVVLGERVWLDRGLDSEPGTLGLLAVGGAVHLATMRAALRQDRLATLVGGVVSMLLMGVFFDRMVRLYERHAGSDRAGETVG